MWNRIHAMAAQRVAACETSATQPHTSQNAVHTHSFRHVVRAGRIEPA